jgi:DNA-binding NarL/FixJ family response regulator
LCRAEGYILKHTSPAEIMEAIQEIYEGGSPMTPSIANPGVENGEGSSRY